LVRRAFDDTPVEPDRFSHAFGEAPRELPARMVFLIDPQGTPVGTSTAWFNRNRGGALVGRIHYVAIAPTHQGRGLAKPLVAETLRRMHARGHDRAYLVTESHRFPAIRVYLDFGFRPDPQGPDDERIWADVLRQLGRAV
jgi:GNAT superfamily N-acetyltransferase